MEQRKAFRHQTITKIAESAVTRQAIEQTQALVDAAELIARHLQLAKAMQSIAVRRIKSLDPAELTPKELISFVNAATTLERLTMGLATERMEVNLNVDFDTLSDEQLERLAKGDDPAHVLN